MSQQQQQHQQQKVVVSKDQLDDIKSIFDAIDSDKKGHINVSDIGEALSKAGVRIATYQIRDTIEKTRSIESNDFVDFETFKSLYALIRTENDIGSTFRSTISAPKDLDNYGGMSPTSTEGTTHTVKKEEQVAFTNWINRNLGSDPDCSTYLPLNPQTRDLYIKCSDGVILCKLINKSAPATIDERAINIPNSTSKLNIYQVHENLTLALNSARVIGCHLVNIGPEDIETGKPHLVLGLLWQIIRIGLLSEINLHDHPDLITLYQSEDMDPLAGFQQQTPEQVLLKWVNYHLERSGTDKRVANFSSDVSDSVAYIYLLKRIAPESAGLTLAPLKEEDVHKRAELTLKQADLIGCRSFVTAEDIVQGNQKLNMAFVANLFNMYSAIEEINGGEFAMNGGEVVERILYNETREEKSYRNWMNSLGVTPYVNYLYGDLTDGLVIFQIYDIIKPGCVQWFRVKKVFHPRRKVMEKIENCNYVVKLGRTRGFSLVGIDGKDLYDGNQTLTLAVVWQLMRAYALTILTQLSSSDQPIREQEIIAWVNDTLTKSGKTSQIHGFNDSNISNSGAILDLIEVLKPGSVNYDVIKKGSSEQDKLDRASYAITTARKIGACVYALPEDVVEVKPKMLMMVFACLMQVYLQQTK
ncbi:hypothetical protein HELRODRAFT_111405 [Helobdella robusta]|uniref:Fimbrin n=1 Tax=Helobdella robusta TaxID=6412 RepID=T1EFA9_HELRO|nr:hypothetical protein HELRODRAFT_111405 [Helobdella robusta]ESO04944.1 hypothetical protein HELRODRAFT_111405 [Helobdella robusta]